MLSKTPTFPNGGWQYPFDFGNGIIAPTFTEALKTVHPFRKDLMVKYFNHTHKSRLSKISVLDLGACEGAMALALWQNGLRDITCVEPRSANIKRGEFVKKFHSANYKFVQDTAENFLKTNKRNFDLTILGQLIWIVSNPIWLMKKIGEITNEEIILETVIAKTSPLKIENSKNYAPTKAAFFIREIKQEMDTGSMNRFEMWPNENAFYKLLEIGGFEKFKTFDYGSDSPPRYKSGEWIFGAAKKSTF